MKGPPMTYRHFRLTHTFTRNALLVLSLGSILSWQILLAAPPESTPISVGDIITNTLALNGRSSPFFSGSSNILITLEPTTHLQVLKAPPRYPRGSAAVLVQVLTGPNQGRIVWVLQPKDGSYLSKEKKPYERQTSEGFAARRPQPPRETAPLPANPVEPEPVATPIPIPSASSTPPIPSITLPSIEPGVTFPAPQSLTETSLIQQTDWMPMPAGVTLDTLYNEIQAFQARQISPITQVRNYLARQSQLGVPHEHLARVQELNEDLTQEVNARRETCTPVVNLKPPMSVDEPPNQESTNGCFPTLASELVQHATGTQASIAYLGFRSTYYIGNPGEGFASRIINGMKSQGFCAESDFPSKDYEFSKNFKDYDVGVFRTEFDKLKEEVLKSGTTDSEKVATSICDNERLTAAFTELFPKLSIPEVAKIIVEFSGAGSLNMLAKSGCKVDKSTALNDFAVRVLTKPYNQWADIDKQLSKGNLVGIEYDSGILEDHNSPFNTLAGHASSIVGRRFNERTGSCEYMLRNSWGKSCAGYSPYYQCMNGHIWIPESYFKYSKAIRRAIYLEKNVR